MIDIDSSESGVPARHPVTTGPDPVNPTGASQPLTAYTWADGYGHWHAVIPANRPNPARVARDAIRRELELRDAISPGCRIRVRTEPDHPGDRGVIRFVEVS